MLDFSGEFPTCANYLMHYRGYGGSTGKPSEAALFGDALELFDQVHTQHPDIDVIGRSLGSSVATYLASQRPVAHLVLVTPFDSVQNIAARQFSLVPVKLLLLDKFESWRFAPRVTAPTTLIAADHDEIVPRESTEALRAYFRNVTIHVIAGGHNTISNNPEYVGLIRGAL